VELQQLGKVLLAVGLVVVAIGAVLVLWGRLGGPTRMPGDVVVNRPGLTVYLPLGTSILLSLVVTVISLLYAYLRR